MCDSDGARKMPLPCTFAGARYGEVIESSIRRSILETRFQLKGFLFMLRVSACGVEGLSIIVMGSS